MQWEEEGHIFVPSASASVNLRQVFGVEDGGSVTDI
jgi:hypothetical protein